jgi:hypothetical protein
MPVALRAGQFNRALEGSAAVKTARDRGMWSVELMVDPDSPKRGLLTTRWQQEPDAVRGFAEELVDGLRSELKGELPIESAGELQVVVDPKRLTTPA